MEIRDFNQLVSTLRYVCTPRDKIQVHTSSLSLTWMVNNFKMFIKYGHSPDCYMSSGVLSCHKYLETIQAFLSPTPHIQQTLRGLGMVLQGEVHHWPTVGFVSGPQVHPPPHATLSTQIIEKTYTRHVNGNWC